MSIWVEFYEYTDDRNNNHAQMKEQAKWKQVDSKDIQRRFFDYRKDAEGFLKSLGERGFHAQLKIDGGS